MTSRRWPQPTGSWKYALLQCTVANIPLTPQQLLSVDPRQDPLYDDDMALALTSLMHKNASDPLPIDRDNTVAPQVSTETPGTEDL